MSVRVRRLRKRSVELDITAFMNLIVVLVPFLLTTTVFTRLAVLELNLPAGSSGFNNLKGDLQLEITIRRDALEVGDRFGGAIGLIENTASGHDFQALSTLMQKIKARFPDKLDATILSEPDTSYDVLVKTMDAVRVARGSQGGKIELFPAISIGDAPYRGGKPVGTSGKAS